MVKHCLAKYHFYLTEKKFKMNNQLGFFLSSKVIFTNFCGKTGKQVIIINVLSTIVDHAKKKK